MSFEIKKAGTMWFRPFALYFEKSSRIRLR